MNETTDYKLFKLIEERNRCKKSAAGFLQQGNVHTALHYQHTALQQEIEIAKLKLQLFTENAGGQIK